MSEREAVEVAVERVFHEAEQVAASKMIAPDGHVVGYCMTAEDWRLFRRHLVAQVTAAVGGVGGRGASEGLEGA